MADRIRREYTKAPRPDARNPGMDEMPEDELLEGFDVEEEEPEEEEENTQNSEAFDANLADGMDEKTRKKIARRILDDVAQDKKSRESWQKIMEEGIKQLGVFNEEFPEDSEPFPGASTVHHPIMGQAVVQFNARAITELFPAGGPVKGTVMGEQTEAKRQQATRVEDHMNYQLTEEDPEYFDELDQMLFYLPLGGSAFKKVYRDTLRELNCSTFLKAEELIVPYTATSLEKAPRMTQEIFYTQNEMRRLQRSGFYLNIELVEASDTPIEGGEPTTQSLDDTVDNREAEMGEEDARHVVYECHCEYDLPGYEDEEDGEKTGICLPYIISVDKESEDVISIRRNWRERDLKKRRRLWFVHYKFLPGLGFYGFGFLHMIGDVCRAATGALRVLLDGAAFASLQGGFKAKDARLEGGDIAISPGTWTDVNMSAEELKNAFFTPPYKEPSATMFQLLGLLTEEASRFASVTETMVGDSAPTGPVGTTVALIEQGSKVFSGIHKRLHKAQRQEFKMLAELNSEYLPDIYPYEVAGASRTIMRQDYDERIDVIPVSDPNIFSSTQRIAQAQAVMQMVVESPGVIKPLEATRRMLVALNVPEPEKLLNDPNLVPRYDPATEGARIMANKPVKAYQDQDHQAHLAVHGIMLEYAKSLPDQERAQGIVMALMEHMAKHEAYQMLQMVSQVTGAMLPPVDLYEEDGEGMPIEVEMMVSQQVAQGAQALAQFVQSQQPPPPKDAETEANIKRKDMEAQAEEQRKQVAFEGEQRRLDAAAAAEFQRNGGAQGVAEEEIRKQQAFIAEEARKRQAFEAEQARADAKLRDSLKGDLPKAQEEDRKEEAFDAEEERKHLAFLAEEKRKQEAAVHDEARLNEMTDVKVAAAKKLAKATPKPKPNGSGNAGKKK